MLTFLAVSACAEEEVVSPTPASELDVEVPAEGGPGVDATPNVPPECGIGNDNPNGAPPDGPGDPNCNGCSDGGGFEDASVMSLGCLCIRYPCPNYASASAACPPALGLNGLNILTYSSCNLTVVRRRIGLDESRFVYDTTTHELVGAFVRTDTNKFTCGSMLVAALSAGRLPDDPAKDAGCTLSNTVDACPLDAQNDGSDQ